MIHRLQLLIGEKRLYYIRNPDADFFYCAFFSVFPHLYCSLSKFLRLETYSFQERELLVPGNFLHPFWKVCFLLFGRLCCFRHFLIAIL